MSTRTASRIDWPTGFERTQQSERSRIRKYSASLGQTTQELADEMERLDPDSWRAETASGGSYTKSNGLPKHNANPDDPGFVVRWQDDGQTFAVACDVSPKLDENVRTVYLWIRETRKRNQRPVVTGESDFAAARLPSGRDEDVDEGGQQYPGPPHELLDVAPDASEGVIKAAARQKKKEHHPDSGGSKRLFQKIVNAEEAMLDE